MPAVAIQAVGFKITTAPFCSKAEHGATGRCKPSPTSTPNAGPAAVSRKTMLPNGISSPNSVTPSCTSESVAPAENQRASSASTNIFGTMPHTFPARMTAAQLYSLSATSKKKPSTAVMFKSAVSAVMRCNAASCASYSNLCRNKSPAVQPVSVSSGKTTMPQRSSSAARSMEIT